ncbi:putative lactoylglutathione lyase [Helianthus annuus]|nr:putative lactoylglutathione lyase [Helianthus annuus]
MKGIAFIKDPDGYWIEIFDSKNIDNVANAAGTKPLGKLVYLMLRSMLVTRQTKIKEVTKIIKLYLKEKILVPVGPSLGARYQFRDKS